MTLPKMKPTPMPGPIVPRPAPIPSAMALPALRPYSWGSAAWAIWVIWLMTEVSTAFSLVLFGDGAAEVDRGEGGEDEGLKGRDEADLEQEEGHGHRAGHEADDQGDPDGRVEQHDEAAAHEEDEQVAGEDVGEETDAQADEADEVGDDLDDEDRPAREALDAGGDPAREVLDRALGPDPLDVVADPHHEREDERDREVGGRGEQRER